MITGSFDKDSPAVFGPLDIYGPGAPLADTCVVTFSAEVMAHALARFDCIQIATICALAGDKPIYQLNFREKRIAFYLSPITAAGAGTNLEEAAHLTGARHFVLFGSCGALDKSLGEGRLIVPTEAYRDEGLSYHYAPAADYITVRNAQRVASALCALGVPHVVGRAWTTDALFRETRANVEKRRAEGCIAVDMECAGLQALCDFRGLEYYTFFYSGDLLDTPAWEKRILGGELEKDHQLRNFLIALEIAAGL
ncbi:MAG: nucleoside phosphorylase [Christensenellales bacterium]